MNLRPMGDRIVVRADELENTTKSGIVLTGSADRTTDTGTVIAVGPEATEFTVNDRVLFVKNTGKEINIDDDTFTVLNTEEVIGTVNNELEAIRDVIVCCDAEFGDQQTSAGIIIKSNIKESQGITSRWMRVHKVGTNIDFLQPGDWVLVEYGRWTEGFEVDGIEEAYRVDPKGCMAVSDEKPDTLYYNSDVVASEKRSLV